MLEKFQGKNRDALSMTYRVEVPALNERFWVEDLEDLLALLEALRTHNVTTPFFVFRDGELHGVRLAIT